MPDRSDTLTSAGPLKELMQRYLRHSIEDMTALLQEHELSLPQVGALQFVRIAGPRSVSEIADHLNLSLGATSHLIDRLVQRNVLARREDPDDRRRKRISLDEGGHALVREIERRSTESLQSLLEPAEPASVAALVDAVATVLAELDDPGPKH